MIPVTAIVVTRNEEANIAACLASLGIFQQIIVVDSQSRDRTKDIAEQAGASVLDFVWNKQYPKKRQWILDTVPLQTDWIFFVDADEILTQDLAGEMMQLFSKAPDCDGYFVTGAYRVDGKILRHGLQNKKLCLFRRTRFQFPVVDDLDIPGMGEIEGHYQPVVIADPVSIGHIRSPLVHTALEDERAWAFRHERYALWEAGMNKKDAWPRDPVPWRQTVKVWLRRNKWRPELMFFLSYVALGGFLDCKDGKTFAYRKYRYYKMIRELN